MTLLKKCINHGKVQVPIVTQLLNNKINFPRHKGELLRFNCYFDFLVVKKFPWLISSL